MRTQQFNHTNNEDKEATIDKKPMTKKKEYFWVTEILPWGPNIAAIPQWLPPTTTPSSGEWKKNLLHKLQKVYSNAALLQALNLNF